jgi:peptidylprolyl isomerase
MRLTLFVCCLLLVFSGIVFGEETKEEEKKADTPKEEVKKADAPKEEVKKEKAMTVEKIADLKLTALPTGVKYYDIVEGKGVVCKLGTKVQVHYTLWFADEKGEKGKRFQSSKDGGKPFDCTLGQRLIPGWSDGMVGMKEGGTRLLVIPPDQGYGQGGGPIPANSTLIFEIEYLKAL